jgi:hypothetical protein
VVKHGVLQYRCGTLSQETCFLFVGWLGMAQNRKDRV